MINNRVIALYSLVLISFILPLISFARAGGGGSSGGGGGHSSGGSFSSGGSNSSTGGTCTGGFLVCTLPMLIFLIFIIVIFIVMYTISKKARAEKIAKTNSEITEAEIKDSVWNKEKLLQTAENTFLTFQKAWGEIDIKSMEVILEPEMYKRISLELSVLNNEKRRNPTVITKIHDITIVDVDDEIDNNLDSFSVQFRASADDKLIEEETKKILFRDRSIFEETWDFVRNNNNWQLKAIHQATEDINSLIPSISDFAQKNNFFYNPDFGWLMLPNKGVLFKDSKFGNTDINNHVIGYYRDKIVEFYTMTIWQGQNNHTDYLIAQAILPIEYKDILIRRKHLLNFFGPSGLRKHEMESNEFIKEFDVYSDENDNISTFELLTPNFMENIMKLPFELTIEVVGNTLYLSTKDNSADYDKMLEILSYAFDEMKM